MGKELLADSSGAVEGDLKTHEFSWKSLVLLDRAGRNGLGAAKEEGKTEPFACDNMTTRKN